MMAFGKHIRKARKRCGLTTRQVGAKLMKSHVYVVQIENGKFPPPSDETILTLAEILDEDPDVLLVMAGRIPAGLVEIIQEHPFEFARLIRQLKGAPKEKLDRVACKVRDGNW